MADDLTFSFAYDGRSATGHVVDMGELGHGLIGMNRIMSAGIVVLGETRFPKRKERLPVALQVSTPAAGSVEIFGQLAPAAAQIPLFWDLITSGKAKTAMEFAAYVLKWRGGRKAEAEAHKENMLEHLRITEAARDRESARVHDTIRRAMDLIAQAPARLAPAAREAVAPVGRSAETLALPLEGSAPALIDPAMADAIRSSGDLTVGDQERLVIDVDGIVMHNRTLKIARLDGAGFMSAVVTDPTFDLPSNLYIEALTSKRRLVVDAKRTLRDGRLERLHISNAVELDAA